MTHQTPENTTGDPATPGHDRDPNGRDTILVTGANGYVGQKVVARLARDGHTVIATDVRPAEHDHAVPGVEHAVLDIRDAEAVNGLVSSRPVSCVVHLAAIISNAPDGDRRLAWDVDVRGTRHVLDACTRHGVGKIIVTSSGAAYGYHPDNPAELDEEDPLRGNEIFAYSHHKRVVEELLADHRRKHPELRQLIFRPGTILGEGTRNDITAIFERPAVLGVRGTSSPFVFIWDEDVAECIAIGARDAEREGIYNLAGDGSMTLAEIASLLGKPYVALPAPVIRSGIRLLGRLGLSPYGPEQVIFLQHRPVLANRRLREEFGFEPRPSRDVFRLYAESLRATGDD
ncbi:MAG: SDR family oxidoreductase [Deltaproteobacteria bacterium]|nr:MAG: SDR family oxidoreductase [Deltaproteobacteria bacterium]